MKVPETATVKVKQADRRLRVLDLRRQGMTVTEIGREMHLSPSRISALLKDILQKLNKQAIDGLNELVQLEEDRIDNLLKAVWPEASKTQPNLKAVELVLKLMERRARLRGLDAPEKPKLLDFGGLTAAELLTEAEKYGITLSPELRQSLTVNQTLTALRQTGENNAES